MFTATFCCFKMTLGRFKHRQDVEGMWATTTTHLPLPVLGCSAHSLVLRWGEKKKKCVYVCSVCVFQSTLTARFPLCQSVAAMEHPGLARPSISRLPWLSAFRHTHIHRGSLMSLHKPLTTLGSEKTKATRYFIKRLQLLCTWAQNKKDSLPRFNTDNRSCRFFILSVSMLVS